MENIRAREDIAGVKAAGGDDNKKTSESKDKKQKKPSKKTAPNDDKNEGVLKDKKQVLEELKGEVSEENLKSDKLKLEIQTVEEQITKIKSAILNLKNISSSQEQFIIKSNQNLSLISPLLEKLTKNKKDTFIIGQKLDDDIVKMIVGKIKDMINNINETYKKEIQTINTKQKKLQSTLDNKDVQKEAIASSAFEMFSSEAKLASFSYLQINLLGSL